jgi:hypothetical protein
MSKSRIKAFGTSKAWIDFVKDRTFDLGDGYKLDIQLSEKESAKKKFLLYGDVEGSLANSDVIDTKLIDFINLLSVYFNVPVEDLGISKYNIESFSNAENKSIATRAGNITGKEAITRGDLEDGVWEDFEGIYTQSSNSAVFDLYRRSLSDSDVANFWSLYNILQILIGERKKIDKYLKTNNLQVRILTNDFEKVGGSKSFKHTLFVSVRDGFSHNRATFDGGTKLNIEEELKNHIEDFRKSVRFVIEDKCGMKLWTPKN